MKKTYMYQNPILILIDSYSFGIFAIFNILALVKWKKQ